MLPLVMAQGATVAPTTDPISTLFNLGGMAAFAFSCFWLLRDQLKVQREELAHMAEGNQKLLAEARKDYLAELKEERAACLQARKEDREEAQRIHAELMSKLDAVSYRLSNPGSKELI